MASLAATPSVAIAGDASCAPTAGNTTTSVDGGLPRLLLPPPHVGALHQRPGAASKTVRVLQWNINELHGPDNMRFSMPQAAAAVAAVVRAANADVLLLQEAWRLSFPPGRGPASWPDSSGRVEELLATLRDDLGYELFAAEEVRACVRACARACDTCACVRACVRTYMRAFFCRFV